MNARYNLFCMMVMMGCDCKQNGNINLYVCIKQCKSKGIFKKNSPTF